MMPAFPKMWRRTVQATVTALVMAGTAGTAAEAPPRSAKNPYVVFMVQWRGHTPTDDGFLDYLASENVPVRTILYDADRKVEALPDIVARIKEAKPDLVYAWGLAASEGIVGTLNAAAAQPEHFVTHTPVVGCTVADPVASGLSPSWETSGRNFTGVSHVPPVAVQINAMKVYDDLKILAALYNPTEQSPITAVTELRQLAAKEGFKLLEFPIPLDANNRPDATALPDLVARIAKTKPTFMYMGPDSFLAVNRKLVTEEANRLGLPTFGAAEVFIREAPGLVGLVSRYYNVGQYCGYKAKEIMVNGKHPKDIPFDTLKRYSYIVNKTTTKRLNYYPPLSIINFIEVVESE
jgi:putative tryptophan/tyrosine transport system substrate-binding protein